jgi:hypothetical protein
MGNFTFLHFFTSDPTLNTISWIKRSNSVGRMARNLASHYRHNNVPENHHFVFGGHLRRPYFWSQNVVQSPGTYQGRINFWISNLNVIGPEFHALASRIYVHTYIDTYNINSKSRFFVIREVKTCKSVRISLSVFFSTEALVSHVLESLKLRAVSFVCALFVIGLSDSIMRNSVKICFHFITIYVYATTDTEKHVSHMRNEVKQFCSTLALPKADICCDTL